ncbi:hypothetical protein P775_05695 [Puniceibacterium antarcticum]|uniref:Right handed beta helix domain-containing protein n=1 Tax=Puniceibacterium antarcticum TaxID=1206336 RepID=A0A2G8RHW0_9RHOB|nr:right-handed parallel beta-helix repeat-containing protein [Puniceibacterium antarcticum]PIL21174.1 hypothetical protein P775_05695 [Puniceibacterium antarcticum]
MRKSGLLALCLVLWFAPLGSVAADSQTSRVRSPGELAQTLSNAMQGGVLLLAGGDYGKLSLRDVRASDGSPLVLRSADPANPARFSGMTLRDVHNVLLENLVFDYTFREGDALSLRPFEIIRSSGVTIRNTVFDGDLARNRIQADDGFPTAFGLSVRQVSAFTLENTEIRTFYRGIVVSESGDITVRGNDLHDIRMDGMNFAQVEQVLIENNHIHDFARSLTSKDHADMIQFWTASTTAPSQHIVIRDNILNSGHGWYTQSIFMRNELVDTGRAGAEMFYRDVTIANNVILNAHAHGITIGETDGLTITNNSLLRNARSEGAKDHRSLWTPRISVAASSRNVTVARNVMSRIVGFENQGDWSLMRNLEIQDHSRMKPGFYGMLFVNPLTGDPGDLSTFLPKKGGALDGTGLGADRLQRP